MNMIEKRHLVRWEYYVGRCRNASVCRWDGERFWYWRRKFNRSPKFDFLEPILHWDDDSSFDKFQPWMRAHEHQVREIPLPEEAVVVIEGTGYRPPTALAAMVIN